MDSLPPILPIPPQVIITRLITSKGRVTSFYQAFQESVKDKGIPGLYEGIAAYVRTYWRAAAPS